MKTRNNYKNNNLILFSVIIPVKKFNNYIIETIDHIKKQKYKKLEIIILPNYIEKKTLKYKNKNLKIIATKKISPGRKRDIGSNLSRGKYLVFLDDDSYPAKNFFKVAENELSKKNIVAIGGPGITPKSNTIGQKISGAFFLTKVTGGNPERYISIKPKKYVDDWPSVNLIIKKKIFQMIGGFNNDYWPGEDTILCNKLGTLLGKRILYVPNLIVYHHRREGLLRHLYQIGNYALHRGFFAKKYPENSFKLFYFIPSIFLICLIFSIILSFTFSIVPLVMLFLAYLIVMIIGLLDIKKVENLSISIQVLPYIFFSHLIYGFSFIRGILKKKLVSKLR